MFKERINKFGKDAIISSAEIIISSYNAYMAASFGDAYHKRKERDGSFVAIAYVPMNSGAHHIHYLIQAGKAYDGTAWIFTDIKNAIRSIKRIKKDAVIRTLDDQQITQLIAKEKMESAQLIEASRNFNQGNRSDLIKILNNGDDK
ncbi:hypothetical protein [Acinetobacter schindleri]|uniref:Uncharacterized protein n=1 Tax=Acinetobacter schindleri CIP 107287 TaxID=1217988 RepID=N9AAU0_9GAMM|nr:hypothetical protein [Acinetobacter schindleri]ENV43244.1 hypothetical protein F955_02791 [Acinetobacter schindleri CIP 107287]